MTAIQAETCIAYSFSSSLLLVWSFPSNILRKMAAVLQVDRYKPYIFEHWGILSVEFRLEMGRDGFLCAAELPLLSL
jgi:hypothetical protein